MATCWTSTYYWRCSTRLTSITTPRTTGSPPTVAQGWATCAITVNGCVRILSSPAYPARVPLSEAVAMLREFCSAPDHHYWPLAPSLTDASLFKPELIPGPKQITDVHLLATAVQHEGKLVTFDRTIAWRAVSPATQAHLVIPAAA